MHAYERTHAVADGKIDEKNGIVHVTIGDGGNREEFATRTPDQPAWSALREYAYGWARWRSTDAPRGSGCGTTTREPAGRRVGDSFVPTTRAERAVAVMKWIPTLRVRCPSTWKCGVLAAAPNFRNVGLRISHSQPSSSQSSVHPAAMVIAYVPTSFWATVLADRVSVAVPMPTTFLLVCIAVAAAALNVYFPVSMAVFDATPFYENTGVLISLLIAFRLNFAYIKWETGVRRVLELHANGRILVSKLCACTRRVGVDGTPCLETDGLLERFRRHVTLACVLMVKHVTDDKSLDDVSKMLLHDDERKAFAKRRRARSATRSSTSSRRASGRRSPSTGSTARSPSSTARASSSATSTCAPAPRPGLGAPAQFGAALRRPAAPSPRYVNLETVLTEMSNTYEQIEFCLTVVPLPYRQFTRVCLLVLATIPGTAPELGWFSVLSPRRRPRPPHHRPMCR